MIGLKIKQSQLAKFYKNYIHFTHVEVNIQGSKIIYLSLPDLRYVSHKRQNQGLDAGLSYSRAPAHSMHQANFNKS